MTGIRGRSLAELAHEPWRQRWLRRAISIPSYALLFVLLFGTAPVWVPLAALFDLLRGSSFMALRVLTGALVFLAYEMAGIVASFALWLESLLPGPGRAQRFRRGNIRLQAWWAERLFEAARVLFRLRLSVDAPPDAGRGPVLIFIRHTHLADALLPAVAISNRSGVQLRYVLKSELLWDPCLDIVGHRLPNCFVRRGTRDTSGDVSVIEALLEDLGPGDGVLIYPEGTRFTPEKRTELLARYSAAADRDAAARVARFRHVLPPRPGGSMALLARNRGADVLFVGHVGFEGAATANDTWRTRFLDRDLRVHCWRVPFAEIPSEPVAQAAWLDRQWERMDAWVGATTAPEPAPADQIALARPSQYGSRSLRL